MSHRIRISTPGRIPNITVGFDIPQGDVIDPATLDVSSDHASLTGENLTVSEDDEEIDGETFPAGHCVIFDMEAAVDMPQGIYHIRLTLDTSSSDEMLMSWQKEVEVFDFVPME